jgi:hypothetical protein
VISQVRFVVVQVATADPPVDAVKALAVYPVIALPPVALGADQLTVVLAWPLAVATNLGDDATDAGVTD